MAMTTGQKIDRIIVMVCYLTNGNYSATTLLDNKEYRINLLSTYNPTNCFYVNFKRVEARPLLETACYIADNLK